MNKQPINPECKLVIAGPGAGKTHNMVQKVLECMETLQPTRFCVVITYTNTATEEIKSRLSQNLKIPPNVFIGTIHSFLNRFIFAPYAQIKGIIQEDYLLIDKAVLSYAPRNHFAQKASEISTATALIDKGLVTYDKLLEKTKELIEDDAVAKQVANRLQYVFVDEYQDIRVWQHDVFMKIFEQGKTHFYCIGDPLQSIFKFTYFSSQNKGEKEPTEIKETPIFNLRDKYGSCTEFVQKNHRSRPVLIDFIHNYTSKIKLEQGKHKKPTYVPIYFIDYGKNRSKSTGDQKKELDFKTTQEIIYQFNALIEEHGIEQEPEHIYRLILVHERNTIENERAKSDAIELTKDKHKETSYLKEISRCILGIVGYKLSEIIDRNNVEDILKYRKFCITILREAHAYSDDARVDFIQVKFKEAFNKCICGNARNIDVKKSLKDFVSKQNLQTTDEEPLFFSTIHSAKGLEATNVLVIAKTKNELNTWLEFNECHTSTNDNHRLGYVAFSRARELLCIACLEGIDDALTEKIKGLRIKLIK